MLLPKYNIDYNIYFSLMDLFYHQNNDLKYFTQNNNNILN